MRNRAIFLPLACMILLTLGCERRKASEDPPQVRSGDTPAQASVLDRTPNPDLLADQAAISRRIERQRLATEAERAAKAPKGPTDQVREMLAGILADVQAGQTERILDIFAEEDGADMRPILVDGAAAKAKLKALGELLKERLDVELPLMIKVFLASSSGPEALADASIDDLQIEQDNGNVVVTSSDGASTTFVETDAGYRAQVPQQLATLLPIAPEMITAIDQFVDQMTEAVNDGDITAENFDAKVKEITEQTLGSAMTKMAELMATVADEGLAAEEGEAEEEEAAADEPDTDSPGEVEGTLRRIDEDDQEDE